MAAEHPYFPKDLKLPHYRPNDKGVVEILSVFFGVVGVFVVLTWVYSGTTKNPRFTITQRVVLCWFMMCGLIHTFLEGYFGVFHDVLAGDMSFLGQVWKEYSMGDSRYMSSDAFVVSMERITAFVDGPLSFLTLLLYFRNSPYRYVIQLIVSLCQLYGDTLYFMTEIFEDFSHGYMYHPQYFWFYFVTMNMFWIVIPSCLIIQSCYKLAKSQAQVDKLKASEYKAAMARHDKKKKR
ncbi:3-beta-hydroxysteroid-Delta(8),Delta(7)-isomerase-like [Haliotis rubra]|uniref:3-beta-hydroxysteroid-Delta(8), Delta(7)-isomerase-like n=1 Tax=Haliotis rubra TaxID=36100 RepID=UPI001EE51E50|nr:3-beta-hydroxysteroid-Delta(8),Delta(7)-isomerase-like [Haliotis rubra]